MRRTPAPMVLAGLVLALMLSVSSAQAHGDWKPEHGGILNDGESTFEFVLTSGAAQIYISDHGVPLSTEGASGHLELLRNGQLLVYKLGAAGDNRLQGRLEERPATGDKLMARVVMGDGSIRVGRIQIK